MTSPTSGTRTPPTACDVLARFARLEGRDVRLSRGRMGTQEFVDRVSGNFRDMCGLLEISHDIFVRTMDAQCRIFSFRPIFRIRSRVSVLPPSRPPLWSSSPAQPPPRCRYPPPSGTDPERKGFPCSKSENRLKIHTKECCFRYKLISERVFTAGGCVILKFKQKYAEVCFLWSEIR